MSDGTQKESPLKALAEKVQNDLERLGKMREEINETQESLLMVSLDILRLHHGIPLGGQAVDQNSVK